MTNNVKKMTPEQAAIYDEIENAIIENGYPPSNVEMALALKCTAQNVNYHLQRMHQNGFIKNNPNIARGIKLLHRGE